MITREYIEKKLDITDSDKYVDLIPEAVSIAEGVVKRELHSRSCEVLLDGNGYHELVLPCYPAKDLVLSIDSTREFLEETQVEANDFRLNESAGIITLFDGVFPSVLGSVKAVFTAGYDPVPSRLQEAILEIVKWLHSRLDNYGERIGNREMGGDGLKVTSEVVVPLHVTRILKGFI